MFTLIHDHKYSLSELENMIPWERDVYISLLNLWVKEETDRIKGQNDQHQQQQRQMMSQLKKRR